MDPSNLKWQSKLVLLLVVVPVTASVIWGTLFWLTYYPRVVAWSFGLSALLGLLAWKSRSGTLPAALTGALICASMMLSTFGSPYAPWRTAIVPILAVLLITSFTTRFGRKQKEKLGMAEEKRGRNAAQVCANLGFAALVGNFALMQILNYANSDAIGSTFIGFIVWIPAYASLAEAAADTVSSEVGQVLGGRPFLLTTLRRVPPGTDGAISVAGTLAGVAAAAVVAVIADYVLHLNWKTAALIIGGGVFGLLFDSLLGATIERKGWLNNDAVNFLSTASAAISLYLAWIWFKIYLF